MPNLTAETVQAVALSLVQAKDPQRALLAQAVDTARAEWLRAQELAVPHYGENPDYDPYSEDNAPMHPAITAESETCRALDEARLALRNYSREAAGVQVGMRDGEVDYREAK